MTYRSEFYYFLLPFLGLLDVILRCRAWSPRHNEVAITPSSKGTKR